VEGWSDGGDGMDEEREKGSIIWGRKEERKKERAWILDVSGNLH
jgi:hypothetical protein